MSHVRARNRFPRTSSEAATVSKPLTANTSLRERIQHGDKRSASVQVGARSIADTVSLSAAAQKKTKVSDTAVHFESTGSGDSGFQSTIHGSDDHVSVTTHAWAESRSGGSGTAGGAGLLDQLSQIAPDGVVNRNATFEISMRVMSKAGVAGHPESLGLVTKTSDDGKTVSVLLRSANAEPRLIATIDLASARVDYRRFGPFGGPLIGTYDSSADDTDLMFMDEQGGLHKNPAEAGPSALCVSLQVRVSEKSEAHATRAPTPVEPSAGAPRPQLDAPVSGDAASEQRAIPLPSGSSPSEPAKTQGLNIVPMYETMMSAYALFETMPALLGKDRPSLDA